MRAKSPKRFCRLPVSLSCAYGWRRQKELEAICSPVMTKMYQGGGAGARPAHMLLACCQPAQAAASERLALAMSRRC